MNKFFLLVFAWTTLAPAAVSQSVWDGTYRLDRDKSHMGEDWFSFNRSADGTWHMVTDQETTNFTPDGKPHASANGSFTQTATMEDAHTLVIVIAVKETPVATFHETLSGDGQTLTVVTTSPKRDGTSSVTTRTATRKGEGNDFFARWSTVRLVTSDDVLLTVSTAADGVVTWSYRSGRAVVQGKPDGTPAAVTGPDGGPGDSIAFKTVSARRLNFVVRTQGAVSSEGYYQLSEDGKVLDDVYWPPGKPSEQEDKVYVRR